MRTLVDSFGSPLFRRATLEAVLIGVIAGVVGVHVILRRLPFFVTAMSHATFPGVVIASTLGLSMFLGGTAFGLVVVAAVLALGAKRALDNTAAIAVVLAGSFALGMLILSTRASASKDLSAILVGSVLTVTPGDVVTTLVVGVAVLGVLGALHKELVFGAFDPAGATAMGYPVVVLAGVLLVTVTVTLVAAVPAVGTLLAIALLTVPALTARLWTDRLGPTMVLAAVFGAVSAFVGLCAAALWSIAAGGAIVLTAGTLFAVSFAATAVSRRPATLAVDRAGTRTS
ncbi:MAG: metal ABC transporter permease [Ilumatobacteraceae bacterium]